MYAACMMKAACPRGPESRGGEGRQPCGAGRAEDCLEGRGCSVAPGEAGRWKRCNECGYGGGGGGGPLLVRAGAVWRHRVVQRRGRGRLLLLRGLEHVPFNRLCDITKLQRVRLFRVMTPIIS
jgi:hypothetical protein